MEKEEKYTQPSSAQSDDEALFSPVLSIFKLEQLPAFCALTRKSSSDFVEDPDKPIEPVAVEDPIFGSYHALFPVRFHGGLCWILKIPACGTPEQFNQAAAPALRSEALTMRLIRRETSIPTPEVFEFKSTFDNELGVPFILMGFIQGISLYDCWFNMKISKEERMLRRRKTLEDVARLMAELSRFSFSTGGVPMYDAKGDLAHTGPLRSADQEAMLERLGKQYSDDDDDDHDHDHDIEPTLYFEAGPFTDPHDFYLVSLDRQKEPEKPLHKGMHRLLRIFLKWIPATPEPRFALTHPDLNVQNILVSEDGSVQGLIDWDGVAAVPRLVGNEKYPSWLTRDWDPVMYVWNEEMEQGIEQDTLWEDSPDTLRLHRGEYNEFMQRFLSPSVSAEQESSVTQKSVFVGNLLIAAENALCRYEIMTKFVDKMVELAQVDSSKDVSDKYGNLELYEVTDALEKGEMKQDMLEFLKKGFDLLLDQSVV